MHTAVRRASQFCVRVRKKIVHHSYKSLKELKDIEPVRRSQILKVSGMRLWKAKKQWKNYIYSFTFIALIPGLAYFYFSNFIENENARLGLLFILYFIGYKVAFHLQAASLLPYIRECIESGITEEELAHLEKVKKMNFKKFSIVSGLAWGLFFTVAMQFLNNFAYSWLIILPVSLVSGLVVGVFLMLLLKFKLNKN